MTTMDDDDFGRPGPGGGPYGRPGGPNGARRRPEVLDAEGVDISTAEPRLVAWLKKIVGGFEEEAPFDLELAQVTNLGGKQEVGVVQYAFDRSPEECVKEILDLAIEDLEGGGYRTKVAYSVAMEGRKERVNFTLEPFHRVGASHGTDRRRDYFPNMEGLTAQLMEQNLQVTDRALDANKGLLDRLEKLLERSEAEVRYLKRGQYQRDLEIQKLMDTGAQRQMMLDDHKAELENKEKFIDMMKMVGPPIIGALAGPKATAIMQMMQAAQAAAAQAQADESDDAPAGAMAAGAGGDASGASVDLKLIDSFIEVLEEDSAIRAELFQTLMKKERLVILLGEMFKRSAARKERAKKAAEEQRATEDAIRAAASTGNNSNGNGGEKS